MLHSDVDDVALLNIAGVSALTTLSRAEIYRLVKEESFPASINVSGRRVAWLKSDVRAWIERRVEESRRAHG